MLLLLLGRVGSRALYDVDTQGDTPLARVIKPFFFGEDNNYRDLRFKVHTKNQKKAGD